MSDLQNTIDNIAHGLHKAGLVDTITLRELSEASLPELIEYTGEEIQELRMSQKMSQAVFARYLNISPAMVRSLEQGKRHAHGAILKLLNIIARHGVAVLS